MLLTYNEFKEIVPKKTLEFVNYALPMLEHFTEKEKIYFHTQKNPEYINSPIAILITLCVYALYKINNDSLLYQYDFNPNVTTVLEEKLDYSISLPETFQKYAHCFCIFDKMYKYQGLTPYMILENLSNKTKFTDANITPLLFRNSDNMNNFFKMLKKINNKEKIAQKNTIPKDFDSLPIETLCYLENVSKIHQQMESIQKENWFKLGKDIEVLSLFLATFLPISTTKKNTIVLLPYFWKQNNISTSFMTNMKVEEFIIKLEKYEVDYLLLNYHYKKYIQYLKKEKNLKEENISIFHILEVIRNRDITQSTALEKVFLSFNQPYSLLDNLEENLEKYASSYYKKISKKFVLSFPEEIKKLVEDVSRIHKIISASIFAKECNTSILVQNEDLIELSMMIALLIHKTPLLYFLEKNGLTLSNIYSYCELEPSLFENLETISIDYECIYENYSCYLKDANESTNLNTITKRLFDSERNESLVLEKIVVESGHIYSILKEEIDTEKEHIEEISIESRIALLKMNNPPSLIPENSKSILDFGTDLNIHAQYIQMELPKMMMEDTINDATNTLTEVLKKLYNQNTSKKRNGNFFKQWFFPKLTPPPSPNLPLELNLNSEIIQELITLINQNIANLSQEITGFDWMQQYTKIYLEKIQMYILILQKAILETQKNSKTYDELDAYSFASKLEENSKLKMLTSKLERFETSALIMKQELIKINQSILNHFITINALETARDDLIPIIQMELAMSIGKNTEKQALELSSNIIAIFKGLITRNEEDTLLNIEKLQQSILDQNSITKIQKDIQIYFSELQKMNTLEINTNSFEENELLTNSPSRKLEKTEPKI